jgi:AAA+ superfamily predicted ATPase
MDIKGIVENIKAGVSGIHIQGSDFVRIDEEIVAIAKQLQFKIKEWNQGYGWVHFEERRAFNTERDASLYQDLKTIADDNPTNNIYVIKNAFSALNNDSKAVARLQQELLRINKFFKRKSAIFLIAKEDIVFPDIIDLLVPYHCPPLASDKVEKLLESLLKEHSIAMDTAVQTSLISILSGMEREMVFRIFEILKYKYGDHFSQEAVNHALTLKKKALSQSGLLELVDSRICIEQIGGLERLKIWLRNKKCIIDDLAHAQNYGISAPKGILLAGMPGCGKSMSAKAAASLFNVPLLRLDIGSLMGKYVGESEANMKAALKVAEQASPCVLWIDELEKAFSGINGAGGSTEITTRLFGYFLTWMQEKSGVVFVMATANDITNIPPELLRRGRFDEIFYVDLPNERERKQIFTVKIDQLVNPTIGLNLGELAEKTEGFSGADIESVINDALEDVFRNGTLNLTQDILIKHIELMTPISVVLKEKIASYEELFDEYCLKAASFFEDDVSSEREAAAASEFISPETLVQLVNDDEQCVRIAALKNPQCPTEALKDVIDAYKSFYFKHPLRIFHSFEQSLRCNSKDIAIDEFNLALCHANMSGDIIFDLYKKGIIDNHKFLSLAHKLSPETQSDVFDKLKVTLSQSTTSGTVQNIRCFPNDIVKVGDILIEMDNEEGDAKTICSLHDGIVRKVYVKKGQTINAGEEVAQILVSKIDSLRTYKKE